MSEAGTLGALEAGGDWGSVLCQDNVTDNIMLHLSTYDFISFFYSYHLSYIFSSIF